MEKHLVLRRYTLPSLPRGSLFTDDSPILLALDIPLYFPCVGFQKLLSFIRSCRDGCATVPGVVFVAFSYYCTLQRRTNYALEKMSHKRLTGARCPYVDILEILKKLNDFFIEESIKSATTTQKRTAADKVSTIKLPIVDVHYLKLPEITSRLLKNHLHYFWLSLPSSLSSLGALQRSVIDSESSSLGNSEAPYASSSDLVTSISCNSSMMMSQYRWSGSN